MQMFELEHNFPVLKLNEEYWVRLLQYWYWMLMMVLQHDVPLSIAGDLIVFWTLP